MNIFQSLIIALSMYTAIPMPMTEWNEKNLRYCMCFLPVAGLIVAAFQFLLLFVCETLNISPFLYGAAFCGLSVLVTGGIHIDGLIDTSDALGSRGEREKKLQILDDPHAGAFGIAGAILYFLMLAGVAAELYGRYERYEMGKYGIIAAVFSAFLTSRALTAVFVVNMAPSKKRGLLYTFSQAAAGRAVTVSSSAVLLLCVIFSFFRLGITALIPVLGLVLTAAYFSRTARRQFGGISGDLCGWLIHMSELALLFCFLAALAVREAFL